MSKKAKDTPSDRSYYASPIPTGDLAADTNKITLRPLEVVQLDSVEALMLLADAHRSVRNADKAGLYIRAAFAQFAKINPGTDDYPSGRSDSLYKQLTNLYRNILEIQPTLPPETPLAVLLEEDTERLKVDPTVKTRIDSLMKVNHREASLFNRIFEEYRRREEDSLRSRSELQSLLPPVPVITNSRVERAMTFFLTRGSGVYQRWLDRAGKMMPVILPILREEGVPEELFCLAMIESGLNPQAYSRARAAGIYQFISTTGEHYGLQSGFWYDDRRDPSKATRAACKYLRKLYNDFGDWYLAIAAYNCGEGRIARTIKAERTEDYWKMRRLPRETRNYVPTYLAALLLFQEPERWGFQPPRLETPTRSDTVNIEGTVDLNVIGRILGISYDELKWRNPELLQFCTDPVNGGTKLRIPAGMKKLLQDSLQQLGEDSKVKWVEHIVRKGETLRSVSRKYNLSEKAISELPWNRGAIRGRQGLAVGAKLRIPTPVVLVAEAEKS